MEINDEDTLTQRQIDGSHRVIDADVIDVRASSRFTLFYL
jgi:hypothetical protein